MTWLRRHPGDRLLNRFADGELGEQDHAAVAAHLAECPRCREEVALVRRLRDVARSLPGPIATDEVLRRALARRSAGERVLLPMSDAGPPPRRNTRRFAPLAAAATLTLMVASLVMSVRVLEADRPALRIHPERPAAGEALRVEYRGGALFADQSHLALRGRYRTADDRHWQLLSGILVRGDDGLYRAEVQIPDSVVYAAFAVEDLHGERLDSNNRELWDVMVHGADGRPTLEAMTARLRDLERRDWGEAYEVAIAMTEAYANEPQAWAIRFSYELGLFDHDSVFAAHREHFERLQRYFAESPRAKATQLAWLATYAVDLGDLQAGERWVERARSMAPLTSAVADAEAMIMIVKHAADAEQRLLAMEELWVRSPHGTRAIGHSGWQAAVDSRDGDAIRLWSKRYLEFRPREELTIVPAAFVSAELRPRLVRELIQFLEQPESWHRTERPLWMPVDDHVRRASERFQDVLGTSAAIASASTDFESARALAALGVDLGWNSEALIRMGQVLAQGGDYDQASAALAKAAADPGISIELQEVGWWPELTPEWSRRLNQSRQDLVQYVMQGSVVRPLPARHRALWTQGGESAQSVAKPTVVVFLSRFCEPALEGTTRLPALVSQVSELGAQLIVVNIDNTSDLVHHLRASGYPGPIQSDPRGELRSLFRSSTTADFFVLDSSGRIRFEHSPMNEVPRQVWALGLSSSAGNTAVSD